MWDPAELMASSESLLFMDTVFCCVACSFWWYVRGELRVVVCWNNENEAAGLSVSSLHCSLSFATSNYIAADVWNKMLDMSKSWPLDMAKSFKLMSQWTHLSKLSFSFLTFSYHLVISRPMDLISFWKKIWLNKKRVRNL